MEMGATAWQHEAMSLRRSGLWKTCGRAYLPKSWTYSPFAGICRGMPEKWMG